MTDGERNPGGEGMEAKGWLQQAGMTGTSVVISVGTGLSLGHVL